MTRVRPSRKVLVPLLAFTLCGGLLAVPSVAHDSTSIAHNWTKHYKQRAKKIFYTKRQANARFVNIGEPASDANLLDGLDSSAFASSSHVHSGDDITSGTVLAARIDALLARDAEVFGIVTDADGTGSGLDADLLDGMSAAAFMQAGDSMAVPWFKESADLLPITATAERVVFTAPENVTIISVTVEPAAALTASDANHATITVLRRDADGSNQATVVAETTQTVGAGGTGSWTAFSTVSLGTLANTSLVAGQKLTIATTKSGLGVTVPILSVHIECTVD